MDSGTTTVKRADALATVNEAISMGTTGGEDALVAANLTSWQPRNGDSVIITGLQEAA